METGVDSVNAPGEGVIGSFRQGVIHTLQDIRMSGSGLALRVALLGPVTLTAAFSSPESGCLRVV
jgi:hypothetical protein